MSVVGADGFQWEMNIGEEGNTLAGDASAEWWRKAQTKNPGELWRITEEYDEMGQNRKYFLRLWKEEEGSTRRLQSSGFTPRVSLSRAQERAREYELA